MIRMRMSLLFIAIVMFVSICGCAATPFAASQENIARIMQSERENGSDIVDCGIADPAKYGVGKLLLRDDQYEYVYDRTGYLVLAVRICSPDAKIDIYELSCTSDEDAETRALNLHLRNFPSHQAYNNEVNKTQTLMGVTMIEVIEIEDRLPTGRKTSVTFSKGGALLSLATYNKPVADSNQSTSVEISDDNAARIVFTDLIKLYGEVLTISEFTDAHWTSKITTYEGRHAWLITIDHLIRTDFPAEISSWSVIYWVDIHTGEIIEKAFAA